MWECGKVRRCDGASRYQHRLRDPQDDSVLRQTDAMDQSHASNRRRSRRVLFQVTVLIRAETPEGKRVQAQGFTLSVNAHGGLLESPLKVAADQRMTVVNPHTGKEVGCRAVRAERASSELFSVAFEFDRPSPQFWPITFSP